MMRLFKDKYFPDFLQLHKLSMMLVSCLALTLASAQEAKEWSIPVGPGEKWYGAAVNAGDSMPFADGYALNLFGNARGNQASPLLLSTSGRFVWNESPFAFRMEAGQLILSGHRDLYHVESSGATLSDAYRAASKKFFPPSGRMPDPLLFAQPQYNTWIELIYNQNQRDILKYAHDIVSNGFQPGVLMIDDNWAPYYGKFEFRKDRFPDAAAMIAELHQMGFKVMLWVCPFISPDTEIFRALMAKRLMLLDNKGNDSLSWSAAVQPAIINWWNGYSALMDFTNPGAVEWFNAQLDSMVKQYGLDGFKLDAGDPEFYSRDIVSFKKVSPNEHAELWGLFGLRYALNEYRAMWKRGGQPLAERLRDKAHNWEDMKKLIPHITAAGLLGYPFACPDMIGGGEFDSFIGNAQIDQELIVRSAQCHALMPMMQFSVAPWRVLEKPYLDAVKRAVSLRGQFTPTILRLASESARSGEPIVKNMEYVFPHQALADCRDQFMLGDSVMVTPMVERGSSRIVVFPAGTWKGDDGLIVKGPAARTIKAPLDRLPWFALIKKDSRKVSVKKNTR